MNDARETISKIFNGEPRSYTRFNLTQNMEGENNQVEMNLASDMDEETCNSTAGHNGYVHTRIPTFAQKTQCTLKNLCFLIITTFLIFIIGYLIGHLAHRRQDKDSPSCFEAPLSDSPAVAEQMMLNQEEPPLDWSGLKTLLKQKLDEYSLGTTFREFSVGGSGHEAGSEGDERLAEQVLARFKRYRMSPWKDEHYVKLQEGPSRPSENRVVFSEIEMKPSAYLAYSASGSVQGNLVYANYGEPRDFEMAQNFNAQLNGSVVILRAGSISFAEKVANAAKVKAAAVLIYPDPADYKFGIDTELYGHVHFGTGDPYTPGFPSFNHTQFPPAKSSGLPAILAQTITATMATKLFGKMNGPTTPRTWEGGLSVGYKLGAVTDVVTVDVNNKLVEKKIYNVFGVIKGFVDPDRYLVIGAQRDSWGPGFAKSTVGTSLLMELARVISDMVENDGFRPRRSIIFASWSAGEYGSIGATEWLEGYLSSLNLKAFSYISLDGVVAGKDTIIASASPLLYRLFESTLKEVNSPTSPQQTLYTQVGGENWKTSVMVPMRMDDAAYPFLALLGIPSISFCFKNSENYPFGTSLDTENKLMSVSGSHLSVAVVAGQVAGQMALRLVHDHLLKLDVQAYTSKLRATVVQINRRLNQLRSADILPKTLTAQWLMSSVGAYSRASDALASDIQDSDLTDLEKCRILNDRIMRVEKNLLSPYVALKETLFRHIFFGSGSHTMPAILEHLKGLTKDSPSSEVDLFRNQFALASWIIQGCANTLAGDIWVMQMEK